jgi:glycosyltransferase involved in cell wall biosynthesis
LGSPRHSLKVPPAVHLLSSVRLLFLNQAFHPDTVATAQYLSDLARVLAARGHQVTVVTSRRAYDNPTVIYPARERWQGVDVVRTRCSAFGKTARWRRALDFASFFFSCALRTLSVPRPDVIVAMTSPPLIASVGACVARWHRSRFVYWVMDLNPEEAIAAGWLRPGSVVSRVLEWISRFSMRSADCVVVLDRFMRDRLLAKGINPERLVVTPPWAREDAVRFDAEGRAQFRARAGLENKFVVMYSGNHSPCHPLATVLEAARALREDDGLAFCFVGGGSEYTRVREYAAEHELQNVVCLPYQPLEELAGSLSAADLHVVVMGDAFVGIVHPCKIYNILAVAAPVLYVGPEPSHISDILQNLDGRLLVHRVAHGDVAGAVAAIRSVAAFSGPERDSKSFNGLASRFSRATLLPAKVMLLEQFAVDHGRRAPVVGQTSPLRPGP